MLGRFLIAVACAGFATFLTSSARAQNFDVEQQIDNYYERDAQIVCGRTGCHPNRGENQPNYERDRQPRRGRRAY